MIYITLGDPYSITVECLSQLFREKVFFNKLAKEQKTLLIGSYTTWQKQGGCELPLVYELKEPCKHGLYFYDLDKDLTFDPTYSEKYRGKLSRLILAQLEDLKLTKRDFVISCPVDKKLTF